ncbi:MAG: tetratricopeptide repeat protein [Myxococcaceae bacterium]
MAVNPAEASDAVFLEALYRGGELLQQGQMTEARDHLERAYQMRPGDEKAKNLLGLAYFKLGDFVRAAEVYEALVRENGADPTLRVNLGLVYLKSNQLTRAVREFETAVDLQPGHLKAHNYLGLALAQAGQYGRAREHFVKAGSDAMAEKMAKALAAEARPAPLPSRPAPAPEGKVPGLTQELPVVSAAQLGGAPEPPAMPAAAAVPVPAAPLPTFGVQVPPASTASVPRSGAAAPAEPLPASPAMEKAERGLRDVARSTTELSTVAGKLPGDGSRTFIVTPEAVRVEVQGEVLVRTAGLLGWTGVIEARAEFKRFRGRVTDKPFGWGPARMHRLVGTGTAWLGVMGRTFLAIDLGDESVYLREDWVFGFEEPVTFENGRVPSEVAPDLDLVHLSGVGQVLLALPGPLRSTEVRHDAPVTVPLQHWVGWQGQLSPRVVALGWEGPEGTPAPAVELSGEGVALLCVPGSAV